MEQGIITRLANRIEYIAEKVESIPGKSLEYGVLLLYIILHFWIGSYHEPWFDEAQAWQIARGNSWYDIIFTMPHWEGHPPLWHVVLALFVKNGIPFCESLLVISGFFMSVGVYLLLFYSPFLKIIRATLPFTYFLFYQYGIVSRPYCMMFLAFILMAMTYKERNEKPVSFVLSMVILCLTSAYGIVIAGGVALVWTYDIAKEYSYNLFNMSRKLFTDRRLLSLSALLICAILLIINVFPDERASGIDLAKGKALSINDTVAVGYVLFSSIADALLSNTYNAANSLRAMHFTYMDYAVSSCIGLIIWYYIWSYGKKVKQLFLFVVPFSMFAIFSGLVHFWLHHIGIAFLYLIFWFWCVFDSKYKLPMRKSFGRIQGSFLIIFIFTIVCNNIFWSIAASKNDITYEYYVGKDEAVFIKSYNLEHLNIMCNWMTEPAKDGNEVGNLTDVCAEAVTTCPYFSKNIFYNFQNGSNEKAYVSWAKTTLEYNEDNRNKWQKKGIPDILFDRPNLKYVYDEDIVAYKDYSVVYSSIAVMTWKNYSVFSKIINIHMKNDLLEKYGVEPITNEKAYLKNKYGDACPNLDVTFKD